MKKVRRIKITVREKELTIVKQGTGHRENPENTQLTVCPVCHSPLDFPMHHSAFEIQARNVTPLLKEGTENELEGER